MSNIPSDLKFTKSHEWVRVSGDTAAIGITDHAQSELTDVVFVELPEVGRKVKAGEACAVVESVKTASDIYSPLSGEIVELNKPVTDNPALVNTEPYAGGWFFKNQIEQSRRTERAALAGGLQEADWRINIACSWAKKQQIKKSK
ncbi:MAG: glycine cleavage system protein GcvH [Limisphaerales bacterium]